MWLPVNDLGDRCHDCLNLDLAIGDLVGNWHHDLGLEPGLNLPISNHGDRSVGNLRLATEERTALVSCTIFHLGVPYAYSAICVTCLFTGAAVVLILWTTIP